MQINKLKLLILIFISFIFSCKKNNQPQKQTVTFTFWDKKRSNSYGLYKCNWLYNIKKDLGYNLKPIWISKSGYSFNSKINISLVSNEYPDIMPYLPKEMFVKLAHLRKLKNLQNAYDKFSSPQLKKNIQAYDGLYKKLNLLGEDGALYSLSPPKNILYNSLQVGWIRKDLLEKLNLKIPKTLDALYEIAVKFSEFDKKDYGFGFGSDLFDGLSSANLIFNYFNIYPNQAFFDTKNIKTLLSKNSKLALNFLKKAYKKELINRDFLQKSSWDYKTFNNSGILFGYPWLVDGIDKNFVPFILYKKNVVIKQSLDIRQKSLIALSYKSKNEDKFVKLLNYLLTSFYEKNSVVKKDGKYIQNNPFLDIEDYNQDIQNTKDLWFALDKKNPENLKKRQRFFYNKITKNEDKKYQRYMGKDSSISLIIKLIEHHDYIIDDSNLLYQDKDFTKIKSKFLEIFSQIIVGNLTIDEGFFYLNQFLKNNKII